MADVAEVRARLETQGLRRTDLDPDPFRQFDSWFAFAQLVGVYQPEAMAVASVDASGLPSVRLVLLRGHDRHGFTFFTNYNSRKGTELDATARAAIVFPWDQIQRQVRVEGRVERVSATESDEYFATRPRRSQEGAWASPQSEVVTDRATLDARIDEQVERWRGHDVVDRPPHWGGYRVVPEAMEFWQGRLNRLHDRFRYERNDPVDLSAWQIDRLAP
jgi:pyridoxamine 5'-phosphate oxidase